MKTVSPKLTVLELFAAHRKTHRCALFVLQLELDERRFRVEVEPIGFDITPRNRDRFDRLIDRLRTNRLHLHLALTS